MGEIIRRPIPPVALPFTGERLTSDYGGQTQIEHLHRYLFARELCRGKDVLDVASGEGYGTALLAQVARRAIGVEIDPEAVRHAATSYARANLSFSQGDARALPLTDASCDSVVSFETIEHFAEQEAFLTEIRRVLRPSGTLIVSTPERDNYSPADTPVNPYHVLELTGSQFITLLRQYFTNVHTLLQRPIFGSVLFQDTAAAAVPLCFEKRGQEHFEASIGLARPQYVIAIASNNPIEPLPSSVYIDTSHLGLLSPVDFSREIDATRNILDSERASAVAMATEELQQQMGEMQQRLADLSIKAETLATELVMARGENKGLLVSNEMAERACATMRHELIENRTMRAQVEREAAECAAQIAKREQELRTTQDRLHDAKKALADAHDKAQLIELS